MCTCTLAMHANGDGVPRTGYRQIRHFMSNHKQWLASLVKDLFLKKNRLLAPTAHGQMFSDLVAASERSYSSGSKCVIGWHL
jgi:hypothetical protein